MNFHPSKAETTVALDGNGSRFALVSQQAAKPTAAADCRRPRGMNIH
jgi:hypothetical protein